MGYTRWYDEDKILSKLMAFLEKSDDDVRAIVANDLLQIVINEVHSEAINQKIEYLKANTYGRYLRWYDNNANLHSAVEIIRGLDTQSREDVILRIIESMIQIFTKGEDYE